MICNKSCCCWINPNWVDDRLYENGGDHTDKYKEIKSILAIRRQDISFEQSFDQLRGLLQNFTFLPNQVNNAVRLIYLTKFEHELNIAPFNAEQEKIIKISNQTDKTACYWLCGGGLLSIITGIATGFVPDYWISIPACLSTTSGCLATGKYPDLSSNAANKLQNIFHDQIKPMYENMGLELIMMSEDDPELAKEISSHINIKNIREAMKQRIWPSGADSLVLPLKEAKKFVLMKKMPKGVPSLQLGAQNVLLRNELKILRGHLNLPIKQMDEPKSSSIFRECLEIERVDMHE